MMDWDNKLKTSLLVSQFALDSFRHIGFNTDDPSLTQSF